MKAVVAVENAVCAFSKELVDAVCASTAPAASTARGGRMRSSRIRKSTSSAASSGAPWGPCAPAPGMDLRPDEGVRDVDPVGSRAASASTGVMRPHGELSAQEDIALNPERWFVGIDWAPHAHEVCILDGAGHVCERRQVDHTAPGLGTFAEALLARAQGDPARIAIAIEVPRGALVELLVERGFGVYAINPKQLDRFRDRFTVAGAKDDRRDALVLGDSLRTDPHAFRRVRLDHPLVIELREWSRVDEDLQVELSRLTNRLRDLVHRVAPEVLALCPAADEPWFWALWRQAPTPVAQHRLSERQVARLLREHRVRRVTAAQVRAVLQRPPLYTAPGVVEAVAAHCQLLAPRVELVGAQRRECGRQLERLLEALEAQEPAAGDQREHRDVAILRSMPGVGSRVAAAVLAEASQPLGDRAYHTMRTCMGVAPVTKQSGRRRTVSMRYACNERLREAAYHWARVGMQHDPGSRAYYVALRARGHKHGRALRSVADRFLRVFFALLKHGQLFDPAHGQHSLVGARA
ncbi:MAG: putative transposase for insertion sequence NGRIS-13h [Alphaproteobacteria bacterium]|nr:MAG: putative transposase for insertion sequence NGRIS-13h [Alphaproteobacteria bacterium]